VAASLCLAVERYWKGLEAAKDWAVATLRLFAWRRGQVREPGIAAPMSAPVRAVRREGNEMSDDIGPDSKIRAQVLARTRAYLELLQEQRWGRVDRVVG